MLVATTPVRFSDRQGAIYEFQYQGVGPNSLKGVVVEQGGSKIMLEKQ